MGKGPSESVIRVCAAEVFTGVTVTRSVLLRGGLCGSGAVMRICVCVCLHVSGRESVCLSKCLGTCVRHSVLQGLCP